VSTLEQKTDLTISIVNMKNPEMVADCLRSIYRGTHAISMKIWVVDNSKDGAGVPELQAEFPEVRWLVNDRQLGFSTNHNQVLSRSTSRYACILNDDVIVHDGAFDTLVKFMDDNPKVGMSGARLLNTDGSQQNCTFYFQTLKSELVGAVMLPGPLCHYKTIGINKAQFASEVVDVDWVLGACIVVRDTALAQIGLLDDKMSPVANSEEVDWCMRAHKHGWRVTYCPDAVITHFGGQSTKPTSVGVNRMHVEMMRTRIAFFRKHYGLVPSVALRAIYCLALPWNALMLTQSLIRKHMEPDQFKTALFTQWKVAAMSMWSPGRCVIAMPNFSSK